MLEQLSRHSLIDLKVKAVGDLHIDQHHTTEDTGIAIGEALLQALGDKRGITRYGSAYAPMDETLTRCALDISGRPYFVWKVDLAMPRLGEWDTELIEHWFHSFATAAGITLHVENLYGATTTISSKAATRLWRGRCGKRWRSIRARPTRFLRPRESVTIALIDYGAGNLQSVKNALKAAGAADVVVTGDPDIVAKADRIVLPGVGAFAHCMGSLSAIDGMVEALEARVLREGVPFLGICVGMQLLADAGVEHGSTKGLGWIGGTVRAIAPSPEIKIPHMGWNDVLVGVAHPVLEAGEAYFLHGYHFEASDVAHVLAKTSHGGTLTAAVGRDNILGVQFHPEKSQTYGIATLKRFLKWWP